MQYRRSCERQGKKSNFISSTYSLNRFRVPPGSASTAVNGGMLLISMVTALRFRGWQCGPTWDVDVVGLVVASKKELDLQIHMHCP